MIINFFFTLAPVDQPPEAVAGVWSGDGVA